MPNSDHLLGVLAGNRTAVTAQDALLKFCDFRWAGIKVVSYRYEHIIAIIATITIIALIAFIVVQ